MSARARTLLGLALAACSPGMGAGCGEAPPEMMMLTAAQWNEDPVSVNEIGYEVLVDIGWPSRPQACFPLSPGLRVTVNDREAGPIVTGACQWDFLVSVRPFTADSAVVVKLHDGGQLLGQATYEGMFPGYAAARLLSPVDGRVRAGEKLVVSLPVAEPYPTLGMDFYWLDTPASVPAFHTFALGTVAADHMSVEASAPMLTGRAMLIVTQFREVDYPQVSGCAGFTSCSARLNNETLGPFPVEVVP